MHGWPLWSADRPSSLAGVSPAAKRVDARAASGLAAAATLADAARLARVRRVVPAASGSTVLAGLVHLAGWVVGAEHAQLSLLADEQVATAVRSVDALVSEQVSALEDSLCTVTVLSGDVLVAADAHGHPWLRDLAPVVAGAVGSYLGVPLLLADGTMVGALCVYGAEPRSWTDCDVGSTCKVADVVALELQRLVDDADRRPGPE